MSRHHIEKITCPNCQKESDFLIWDSINTSLDTEMKEKVRTGEAFLWNCPFCNTKANVEYATLYHQMEDLVMIYYVPGDGDKTETIELMQGRYKNEDGKYVEMDMKMIHWVLQCIRLMTAGRVLASRKICTNFSKRSLMRLQNMKKMQLL